MPAAASNTISRRDLLRGRTQPQPAPFRPPWTDDHAVRDRCTGCGDCVAACPEDVLRMDRGYPAVALGAGKCTFCGACAEACPAGVFGRERVPPWPVRASVSDACLLAAGIACQLCTDACPEQALRMDLSQRPVGRIEVRASACTGCGACLGICPAGAIQLEDGRAAAA
jgi:ferredoxin-type protein NapF